ncbi:hypothetical protein Btru_066347 [Bulinus truncatus]|nr:hypothetical protein Btru_066347 [Bulinus truncatus]
MFTLLVIAVDRYRKICLPLKPQMYNRHVKISMIPILILSVLFGLPAFAVHGQRTIDTDIPGLYGMDCSTPDEIGKTVIPLIYNLVMFLVFFTITVALAVLYTFILRETNRHTRNKMLRAKYTLPAASNSSSDRAPAPTNVSSSDTGFASGKASMLDVTQESDVTCYTISPPTLADVQKVELVTDTAPTTDNEEINTDTAPTTDNEEINTDTAPTTENEEMVTDTAPTTDNEEMDTDKSTLTTPCQSLHSSLDNLKLAGLIPPVKIVAQKAQKTDLSKTHNSKTVSISAKPDKKRLKNKTTIIAFVVTLVFILSFLPHFIVQVTKFSKLIVDYRLHGAGLVAYNLCLRSYFINSVSNPFIYGALNTKFSSEKDTLMLLQFY